MFKTSSGPLQINIQFSLFHTTLNSQMSLHKKNHLNKDVKFRHYILHCSEHGVHFKVNFFQHFEIRNF